MKEEWKDIKGYEGRYQISNYGNIKSFKNGIGRILKPVRHKHGYMWVSLCDGKTIKPFLVHRIVAETFIPNPNNLKTVNHKDENKENNNVDNLEWMSLYDNLHYGTRIERYAKARSKSVMQYTLDGKFVKEFSSMNEVKRTLGFNTGSISSCCRGKCKQVYGYIWKYKEN